MNIYIYIYIYIFMHKEKGPFVIHTAKRLVRVVVKHCSLKTPPSPAGGLVDEIRFKPQLPTLVVGGMGNSNCGANMCTKHRHVTASLHLTRLIMHKEKGPFVIHTAKRLVRVVVKHCSLKTPPSPAGGLVDEIRFKPQLPNP